MPRCAVDYSKTVIYKIQHNEDDTLLYIGSTTDFTNRKSQHKCNCNNDNKKNKKFNRKVYKMIRENGGWDSFSMVQIEVFPCETKRDAEAREDELMRDMKASMNSIRAFIKDPISHGRLYDLKYNQEHREERRAWACKKTLCVYCSVDISNSNYITHEKSIKHINNMRLLDQENQ